MSQKEEKLEGGIEGEPGGLREPLELHTKTSKTHTHTHKTHSSIFPTAQLTTVASGWRCSEARVQQASLSLLLTVAFDVRECRFLQRLSNTWRASGKRLLGGGRQMTYLLLAPTLPPYLPPLLHSTKKMEKLNLLLQ